MAQSGIKHDMVRHGTKNFESSFAELSQPYILSVRNEFVSPTCFTMGHIYLNTKEISRKNSTDRRDKHSFAQSW